MVTVKNTPYKVECYPDMDHTTTYNQTITTTCRTSIPTENLPSITEETDEDLRKEAAGKDGMITILLDQDQDIGCCGILPPRYGYSTLTERKSKRTGLLRFRMGHLFCRKRQRIRSREQKTEDRTFNDVASISDYDSSIAGREDSETENESNCDCEHGNINIPECRLLETKSDTETESEHCEVGRCDMKSAAEREEEEEEEGEGEEEEGSCCCCCTPEERSVSNCCCDHYNSDEADGAMKLEHVTCEVDGAMTTKQEDVTSTRGDHVVREACTDVGEHEAKTPIVDGDGDSESCFSDTVTEQSSLETEEVSDCCQCHNTGPTMFTSPPYVGNKIYDSFTGYSTLPTDRQDSVQPPTAISYGKFIDVCPTSSSGHDLCLDKPLDLLDITYQLQISGSVYTTQVQQEVMSEIWSEVPTKTPQHNSGSGTQKNKNYNNKLLPSQGYRSFPMVPNKYWTNVNNNRSVMETQSTDTESDDFAEEANNVSLKCNTQLNSSADPSELHNPHTTIENRPDKRPSTAPCAQERVPSSCESLSQHGTSYPGTRPRVDESQPTTPNPNDTSHFMIPCGDNKHTSTTSCQLEKSCCTTPHGHERAHSTTPHEEKQSHSKITHEEKQSHSKITHEEEQISSAQPYEQKRANTTTPHEHQQAHSRTPCGHEQAHSRNPCGYEQAHSTTPCGYEQAHSTTPHGQEKTQMPTSCEEEHPTTPHERETTHSTERYGQGTSNASTPRGKDKSCTTPPYGQDKFHATTPSEDEEALAATPYEQERPYTKTPQELQQSHPTTPCKQDEVRSSSASDLVKTPPFSPPVITTSPLIMFSPGFIYGSGSPFGGGLLALSRDTPIKRLCVFCGTTGCKECKPISTKQRLKVVPKR